MPKVKSSAKAHISTIPDQELSELALPIRELVKEKVAFNWGPEHQAAFKLVKKEIAVAPILVYYDPKKTTVLQTDASINGFGVCLLQDEKPVYFASKALMEAQRGYVAIELKSLAVALAMEKFHHFLYGNQFLLETDQNLLETILSRSLSQATTRLQRDTHQNVSLQLYCVLSARTKKPVSRLLVQSRGTSRFHQAAQAKCIPNHKPTQCKK